MARQFLSVVHDPAEQRKNMCPWAGVDTALYTSLPIVDGMVMGQDEREGSRARGSDPCVNGACQKGKLSMKAAKAARE